VRYSLSDGGVIEAGVKLGEGGEGVVYEALDGQRAIKLYHKPLAGRAADKLRAMVSLETLGLGAQAAWPQALIAGPGGAIAGFVMQKAAEPFDIHAVYSPRDRREKLPRADWRFLVHVAANLAAAFHAAHEAGVVIGDVNHGSVRVGKDGRVRLIDCDSYQITQDGKTLRCGVGVDAYTPPELQGVSLADVDRTRDHDAFGLAVLIFQLLFMGRHPFAGAPRVPGAPTDIPAAIAARAYAYAAAGALLRPPPSAPPIDLVSPDLVLLFEQAFAAKGHGHRP
jgi:DNA-binding helix-hairpin-helix protein with protein kinase domain